MLNKAFGCVLFVGVAAFLIAAGVFAYGAHTRTQFVFALIALVITPLALIVWGVIAIIRRAAKAAVLARPAVPAAAASVVTGICGLCFKRPARNLCTVHGSRYCQVCVGHHHSAGVCNYIDVKCPELPPQPKPPFDAYEAV